MSTYQKIQFIAYEINTGPKMVSREVGRYKGLTNDSDDMVARQNWTFEVLTQALAKADRSKDTLKVFMMPEFYFRGVKGAYSLEIVTKLIDGLQHQVRGPEWNDWLIVYGTIVGYSSVTRFGNVNWLQKLWGKLCGDDLYPIDEEKAKTIYNFSLIQKGGWAPDSNMLSPAQMNDALESKCFVTMKEFMSDIDFVLVTNGKSSTGFSLSRVMHLDQKDVRSTVIREPGREERRVNYEGACLFEIDGIQFGLEICLDHAKSRLKNSPRPENLPPIQVQLVPSCGWHLGAEAMVTMKGGYGFNVEGLNGKEKNDHGATSQLAIVTSDPLGRVKIMADKSVDPRTTIEDVSTPPVMVPLINEPYNFSSLFARGVAQLAIYQAVNVPGVKEPEKIESGVRPEKWRPQP